MDQKIFLVLMMWITQIISIWHTHTQKICFIVHEIPTYFCADFGVHLNKKFLCSDTFVWLPSSSVLPSSEEEDFRSLPALSLILPVIIHNFYNLACFSWQVCSFFSEELFLAAIMFFPVYSSRGCGRLAGNKCKLERPGWMMRCDYCMKHCLLSW